MINKLGSYYTNEIDELLSQKLPAPEPLEHNKISDEEERSQKQSSTGSKRLYNGKKVKWFNNVK